MDKFRNKKMSLRLLFFVQKKDSTKNVIFYKKVKNKEGIEKQM